MRVVVVSPPAPVVTLAEAKAHLGVDAGDDDLIILGMIEAATRGLDGPGGWLGRALGAQTLRAFLEPADFPTWSGDRLCVDLPYPPTRSQDPMAVSALSYWNGVATVAVDPASYSMDGPARRLRVLSSALPWAARDAALTYTTGAPQPVNGQGHLTGAPAQIDARARAAILLDVAAMYVNREAEVIDARAVVAVNPVTERLLTPLRIWR